MSKRVDTLAKAMADLRASTIEEKEKKMHYTNKNALLKYFNGDELAADVYAKKYQNHSDFIKKHGDTTPDDMLEYIAKVLHKAESKYINPISEEDILKLIDKFKYLVFGGSIMYGLNHPNDPVSLGNCFVVGDDREIDSYSSIMRRDEEQIQLMKRRGGVGQDLSFIRPKGAKVNNAAKTSAGVVPFAKRYSNSTKEVAQDGRRGASMLTLDFDHPDIMRFINAKSNTSEITGSNISVKIDDYEMDRIIDATFPKEKEPKNEVWLVQAMEEEMADIDFDGNGNYNETPVEERFSALVKNARDWSEPGILFWDKIEGQIDASLYSGNNPNGSFRPISTNPCGELPLAGYDSCRLASLNLYSYVNNPFTKDAEFDFDLFEKHVMMAQRLMDDVVDLEIQKIDLIIKKITKPGGMYINSEKDIAKNSKVEIDLWKKIKDKAERGRRTGLGWMGVGDMFAALGLKYASKDAIFVQEEVSKTFMYASYKSSIIMAEERGAFPEYVTSETVAMDRDWYPETLKIVRDLFYDEEEFLEKWNRFGRRNIQNLAIAPTGTISIQARVSSGIEPVFNIRYRRRKRADDNAKNFIIDDNGEKWEEYNVIHPKFVDWYTITYPENNPLELLDMDDDKFNEIVKDSPYYGSTAHEVDPIKKITLQGTVQRYIDSSISITHNVPEDITEKEVHDMILYAYEIGCKGFTIYREGSRGGILLNNKEKKAKLLKNNSTKRPKVLNCDIHTLTIKGKKWVVIVGLMDKDPYEVFAFESTDDFTYNPKSNYSLKKVKKGVYSLIENEKEVVIEDIVKMFDTPEEEFATRLISTSLRHGADVKFICEQLIKSSGDITQFSKAIARVLRKYISNLDDLKSGDKCPVCSGVLKDEGGCPSCSCGWSRCD